MDRLKRSTAGKRNLDEAFFHGKEAEASSSSMSKKGLKSDSKDESKVESKGLDSKAKNVKKAAAAEPAAAAKVDVRRNPRPSPSARSRRAPFTLN